MEFEEFLNNDEELDVQKAVVESLAADKAAQDEHIENLKSEIARLKCEKGELELKIANLESELKKAGDFLSKNTEGELSNKVTLLERTLEIDDRFEGETRDHVLEAIRDARDNAEKEGYCRKAQLLESVLVANQPNGELEKRREKLKKLFDDNQNVINGQVINELDKMDIAYKVGDKYLLVGEIIKRVY